MRVRQSHASNARCDAAIGHGPAPLHCGAYVTTALKHHVPTVRPSCLPPLRRRRPGAAGRMRSGSGSDEHGQVSTATCRRRPARPTRTSCSGPTAATSAVRRRAGGGGAGCVVGVRAGADRQERRAGARGQAQAAGAGRGGEEEGGRAAHRGRQGRQLRARPQLSCARSKAACASRAPTKRASARSSTTSSRRRRVQRTPRRDRRRDCKLAVSRVSAATLAGAALQAPRLLRIDRSGR